MFLILSKTIFEFLIFMLLCFVYIIKLMKINKDDNNKEKYIKIEVSGKLINED